MIKRFLAHLFLRRNVIVIVRYRGLQLIRRVTFTQDLFSEAQMCSELSDPNVDEAHHDLGTVQIMGAIREDIFVNLIGSGVEVDLIFFVF